MYKRTKVKPRPALLRAWTPEGEDQQQIGEANLPIGIEVFVASCRTISPDGEHRKEVIEIDATGGVDVPQTLAFVEDQIGVQVDAFP